MRPELPSGTVTFLFTDVEGSTKLLGELGEEGYAAALASHRDVIRTACGAQKGVEVDTQGDAFFFAFPSAPGALAAASDLTEALASGPISVRVGLHTGIPLLTEEGYVGHDLHRAARIAAFGHGGQVLVSSATASLIDASNSLLQTSPLRDLGEHRFKDLQAPERVFQLGGVDFAALKTLYRTNLPIPASSLVGRERELSELTALLAGEARMLTLTGPGGTGKTRLALQAAAEASDTFPDGVWWVALAPLRDPRLVLSTLARALELREEPGRELPELLVERLGGKKALVLLDNAEHLLPSLAGELSPIVRDTGTVTWMVTSRERLQVTGEQTYPVPTLEDAAGVELFLERAASAGAQVSGSEDVRELCARLDHLPLALELAAARSVVFTPTQLLERLSQRLDLLTGARDADPRQQTLRATIEWSHDLLSPEEQRLFRWLSVFAGGCTYEAAERIAGADPDTLQSLLDKSLLRRRDAGLGRRYWMLETVSEFAGERLDEAGESDRAFEAHLAWIGRVVGEVDEYWADRDQLEWFNTLEAERSNLMGAIAGCRERARDDDALRLIVGASEFVDTRGPHRPFLDILGELHAVDAGLEARALLLRVVILVRLNLLPEAVAAIESMKGDIEALGDHSLVGHVLDIEAYLTIMRHGEKRGYMETARAAVEQAEAGGDLWVLGQAHNTLGIAMMAAGEPEAAAASFAAARKASERIGDRRNALIPSLNEAGSLLATRRPEEANAILRVALDSARELGDSVMEATALGEIAIAEWACGRPVWGAVRDAVAAAKERDDDLLLGDALVVLALASETKADPERAVVLWSAGWESGAAAGYDAANNPELSSYVTEVLEPLREWEGFAAAWEVGRTLSLDEALELGLSADAATSLGRG